MVGFVVLLYLFITPIVIYYIDSCIDILCKETVGGSD